MIGGGAFFFSLAPRKALIADVNEELINFYQMLKTSTPALIAVLLDMKASVTRYYRFRSTIPTDPLQRAVRFAYLNRLSWNGLYRVNRLGQFNVPIGDRLPHQLWKQEDLENAARALRNACIVSGNFEKTLARVKRGDLVFLDPPYPRGAKESPWFNRYSAGQFTIDDHRCLAQWVHKLTHIGAKVLLTLCDDQAIRSQYPTWLESHVVTAKSLISCNESSRRKVREVIMRNFRS